MVNNLIYFTHGNLGPYHLARFRRLAREYPRLVIGNILSKGYFRPWPNDAEELAGKVVKIGAQGSVKERILAVIKLLNQIQPQAVILSGYADLTQIAAAHWAKRHGAPRIMHADSWYGDHPRYWLKEKIKRFCLVKPNFDAAFVPGIRGYQYILSLGMPEDSIWRGLYVVDNDYFEQRAAKIIQERDSWRSRLEMPENYFLTVSRLNPEKNLLRLLKAFALYRQEGGDWDLVIVGTGPQEGELKNFITSSGISAVHFAGWAQYDELPGYYALARCFILPSISEPWGLVVNEAMASGLAVLVSRQCGCLPELCHRGINGFDFDPLNVEGLARLMLRFSRGEKDLRSMADASRRIIANYSLDTWLQSLVDCVETTVHSCRLKKGRNLL